MTGDDREPVASSDNEPAPVTVPVDDQPGGGAEPGAEDGPGDRTRLLVVALAVVAGLSLVLAGVQWQRAEDLVAAASERAEVAAAAGEVAVALLSYDFTDLETARQRVATRTTEQFAQQYAEALEEGLGGVIGELQAVAEARVQQVLVGTVRDGAADAVVVADTTVTASDGSTELTGAVLRVGLVRVDGRWLADDVRSLAAVAQDATGSAAVPGP